jgi:serine O-acetyltransferase
MSMLVTDLSRIYRHVGGRRARRILNCYLQPGFRAIKVYRFGHWLLGRSRFIRLSLWPVYLFLYHIMKKKWGIAIFPGAVVGSGFLIFHHGGIFVGPAVIGRNVTINHEVTIGEAGVGTHRGAPTIGDNVLISPGAKLAGKIKIGNNVRIGANAVVQRDVPDNALVQVQAMQIVTFPSFYSVPTGDVHSKSKD